MTDNERRKYKGKRGHRGLKKGQPRKCCSTLGGEAHLPMCGNYKVGSISKSRDIK